jgi:hypothetical protein
LLQADAIIPRSTHQSGNIKERGHSMKPAITDIPGIGPAAVAALGEHGIKSLAGLANSSVEKINTVPGFSEARSIKVLAAATELLAASRATPADSDRVKKSGKKDKKDKKKNKGKGKDKKKKKDKKKGKGKKKGKK